MVETYIIAELGINHLGDVRTAEDMIKKASSYGADAVKLQTYSTTKRVSKDDELFPILRKCELTFSEHRYLQKIAQENRIDFFSTPFDEDSLSFLLELNVPYIKIASFDLVNISFLKKVAGTHIPVLLSTGMATLTEIKNAVNVFEKTKTEYTLLHCVSAYPTPLDCLNLQKIKTLQTLFKCRVGYSDHSGDNLVAPVAVAIGAEVIELHFVLHADDNVPDSVVSLSGKKFEEAVKFIRNVEMMRGTGKINMHKIEEHVYKYRRYS